MKFFTFLIFSLLCNGIFSEDAPEIKEDEGVLVLTDKNFEHAVTTTKYVLVEFYAPWCGHCKALAPEYAKAAAQLKSEEPDIKLAKVDATVETSLASKHQVRGYPTLKFFKDGKAQDYQGGRQAPDIVSWLKKKTGPPCKVLSTEDDVKQFKDVNQVVVIGAFPSADSDNAKKYEDVAGGIDDVQFGILFDADVASSVDVTMNTVTIFKQFDEGRADYEGDLSDTDALSAFIKGNQLRLVNEFTTETAPKLFGGDVKVHNLLFVSKASDKFQEHHDSFKEAAKEFKGKVLFVFVDTDQPDNKRVIEFFGLSEDNLPEYRIIKMEENMAKFKPETMDLSTDAVVQFTKDVLSGSAKRHLMSQEIPEDWNKNPVTVLVGKNFVEVAFDRSKKVFVEFYAPWCGHCKALKPTWEKLGEQFKDDDSVVIAMMDSTANEVQDIQISGFPTLKFFPSDSDTVLDYRGDRSVDAMAEYVKSNGEKVQAPGSPLPPKEYAPPGEEPFQMPGTVEVDDDMKEHLAKANEKARIAQQKMLRDIEEQMKRHFEEIQARMKKGYEEQVPIPDPEEVVGRKKEEL